MFQYNLVSNFSLIFDDIYFQMRGLTLPILWVSTFSLPQDVHTIEEVGSMEKFYRMVIQNLKLCSMLYGQQSIDIMFFVKIALRARERIWQGCEERGNSIL